MPERKFGRVEVIDERDKEYPISEILDSTERPDIPRRFWFADGWWGNQGSTSQCVAYSWMHFLEDGPVIQDTLEEGRKMPFYNTTKFYRLCQKNDQWVGENYDGTSVRAGAKILKKLGVLESYRWAWNIGHVIKALQYIGPVIVGTPWYYGMFEPTESGLVRPTGFNGGGHAYVLNGYDSKLGVIRLKNSWGRKWGKKGFAYITCEDFERLLGEGGEACIPFENKMHHVPDLLLG